ncbi:MAG: alginate export family protein [Candidatus Omnitrophica bacterium]|nr:alginate export family protein [Candidatus Omnitrophota bacterium]
MLVSLIFFLSSVTTVHPYENQRRVEEEKRTSLAYTEEITLNKEERLLFDFGGWIDLRYDEYHNIDNDNTVRDAIDYSESIDFRVWIKAILKPAQDALYENEHSLYIRMKDMLIQERPDDSAGGSDHDGPHIDYAYITLDFRPVWLEIGRSYYSIGQGIAYSDVHDGAELLVSVYDWQLKGFASHTLPNEDNIDTSVPGYQDQSDRYFYGVEGRYRGCIDHEIYTYLLLQRDFSNEEPEDPAQNYTYDSEYIGLGAEGMVGPSLRYWAEIIYESGKSRIYASNERKDINAWGGVMGTSYDWDVYSHPAVSCIYGFGSGDSDRGDVTDTFNGNTYGRDENFLPFGYINTGYVLSPRLSNLHYYTVGVTCAPLESVNPLKKIQFGIDYYRYYKDAQAGGISDTDATSSSRDIGHELDATLSWDVTSDLSFVMQYGHFFPGAAYPAATDDDEHYFSFNVTLTI